MLPISADWDLGWSQAWMPAGLATIALNQGSQLVSNPAYAIKNLQQESNEMKLQINTARSKIDADSFEPITVINLDLSVNPERLMDALSAGLEADICSEIGQLILTALKQIKRP
jgi:hypothetical protein